MVDGAGTWYVLLRIIVPLSKPVIATIALFTIVGHWNDFFQGLVLSTGEDNYPLQTYINAQPWNPELAQMNRWPGYRLITEQIGITYHGYTPEDTPSSIDHFYLRDGDVCRLRVHSLEKWEDREGVLWLSDHYLVCATLSFEKI